MEKNKNGINLKDNVNKLPAEGFLRLKQIIGSNFYPPIIPISKSSWWSGVKKGIFPQPIKLGKRTTVWKISDIRNFINESNGHE